MDVPQTDAQTQALGICTLTLVQGGIAIMLIQRFGRMPRDTSPLAVPLRIGMKTVPGGYLGLPLWVLGGMATLTVFVISAAYMGEPSNENQFIVDIFGNTEAVTPRIILLAAGVILAPVFEEILFRGFVYRNLKELMGPGLAIVASGFIFGLVHVDVEHLFVLSVLGACLAWIYEVSGSLLVCVIVHGAWNLSAFVTMWLQLAG